MKRYITMLLILNVLVSCIGCAGPKQTNESLSDSKAEQTTTPLQTPDISSSTPSLEIHPKLTNDGSMVIHWPYGEELFLISSRTEEASCLLRKGPYASLAQAPLLCHVLFDGFNEDDTCTFLLDNLVWVNNDDYALIRKYGLENACFANNYELYNFHSVFESMKAFTNEGTSYSIIGCSADGVPCGYVQISAESFINVLRQRGDVMLAYVYANDDYILDIEEVYVP